MKKAAIFFLDIIILYASLIIALLIRYWDSSKDFGALLNLHLAPFSIIFLVWLLVFYIDALYDSQNFRNTAKFYSSLFSAIAIASGISIVFFYLIPFLGITPKTNLFVFIVIFTLLELANRLLFNNLVEKKFKKTALIVGTSPQAIELANFMIDNPQFGYDFKYIVNLNGDKINQSDNLEKIPTIQSSVELEHSITDAHAPISTIIISPEAYQSPEIINIFYKSLEHKITFYGLASFYERLTGRVPLGAINQVWFLENLSEGNKKSYEILKRLSDIVFATAIGAMSLIFYPFIIFAIKIDSSGPVFYKQKRIGQIGKIFKMLKFRTMSQDAEKTTGAVWAADNDPRITKVGKFLRKTRIDELPQLWNILKGEMSLVGPRAERPEFHKILKKEIPFYEERYLIKPGLSGWAQINFRYGSSIQDAAEKLQYDLYYIKNRSLMLDLGIALKTARIALQQSGK